MNQAKEQKATTAEPPPGALILESQSVPVAEPIYTGPPTPAREKKRKKRYSKGTKDLQRLEQGVSKASWRVANAVTEGIESYRKRSRKAARRRKDGSLRDLVPNLARALGDAGGELAKAPADFVRQIPTRIVWRQARAVARVVTPLAFLR